MSEREPVTIPASDAAGAQYTVIFDRPHAPIWGAGVKWPPKWVAIVRAALMAAVVDPAAGTAEYFHVACITFQ